MGFDEIHPAFLRHSGPIFHLALATLFNESWSTGVFPSEWKISKAVAIYKGKGGREYASNYRLICVTSIVSRTFEHLVLRRLCAHFAARNFFHTGQAGFRHSFSTYDNIFRLQRCIYRALQRQSHLPVAFLDISKAFDTVCHDGLLYKLDEAGIKGNAWSWLKSFLEGRSFSVVDRSVASALFKTTAGVPQGCVLSPLLFLVFINDLPALLKDVNCLLFADDIAISPCVPGPRGHVALQVALRRTKKWATRWKVVFSIDKSQVVCFNNKQYEVKLPEFKITETPLQVVASYRYLGVILHETGRNWDEQCRLITSRLSYSSFCVQRFISFRSAPSAQAMLQLMKMPVAQLEYGFPFWRPTKEHLQRLLTILVHPLRRFLALPRGGCHRHSLLMEFGLVSPETIRLRTLLQFASRCSTLHDSHPVKALWSQDLQLSMSETHYCRPVAEEAKDTMSVVGIQLPADNEEISQACLAHDIRTYELCPRGKALKEIRTSFGFIAPYLRAAGGLLVIRIRARLRFDLAPLNHSLHRRGLAPSPLCDVCKVNETRSHVILECPKYDTARMACIAQFSLPGQRDHQFDLRGVLDSTLSAKFLLDIHRIRRLL